MIVLVVPSVFGGLEMYDVSRSNYISSLLLACFLLCYVVSSIMLFFDNWKSLYILKQHGILCGVSVQ